MNTEFEYLKAQWRTFRASRNFKYRVVRKIQLLGGGLGLWACWVFLVALPFTKSLGENPPVSFQVIVYLLLDLSSILGMFIAISWLESQLWQRVTRKILHLEWVD